MEKLSTICAPALAGVVREKTKERAIAEIKTFEQDGADMIDLHMSCLEDYSVENLREIIASSSLPILALNYNFTTDWKDVGLAEQERAETFLTAAKLGASGIDMQGYTFDIASKENFCGVDKYSFTKGNPKEIVTDEKIISKQCEFIEKIHREGGEVLLSCHPGIAMNTTQVVELALFLEKRNPDIIKIVTIANSEEEMLEGIKTMRALKSEIKTPVSFHCGGEFGGLTRVVNPALGGQIAFCVNGESENATPGQLDLKTAKLAIENLKKLI